MQPAIDPRLVAEELYTESYRAICRYVDILADTGLKWGLIGPREVDRLWDRHILNGVAIAQLIPEGSTVVDVGSGAGIPGIPLAILRPDLQITLLEPLLRRFTFLTQTVENLGITNARVVRGRAEEHRALYEVVTGRAVAPLERLVEWCEGLRRPDGVILAMKGQAAGQELSTAEPLLRRLRLTGEVLSVRAHPDADPTNVVRIVSRAR